MADEEAVVAGRSPHRRRPRRNTVERRTQAERSAETQRKLMDGAIAVLHRVGYSAATISLIAEEAGVSRGAMFHQYPTKIDLMLALVAEVYQRQTTEYRRRMAETASPRERFYRLPDFMWDAMTRPSATAVLEIMMGARSDPELAKSLAPLARRIDAASRATVEQYIHEAGFSNFPLTGMRHLFVGAVRGLSIELMLLQDRAELEEAIHLLKRVLKALGEGLIPQADEDQPSG